MVQGMKYKSEYVCHNRKAEQVDTDNVGNSKEHGRRKMSVRTADTVAGKEKATSKEREDHGAALELGRCAQ